MKITSRPKGLGKITGRIEELGNEVRKLRAALKPFAKMKLLRDEYPEAMEDDLDRRHGAICEAADVRRARRVLGIK